MQTGATALKTIAGKPPAAPTTPGAATAAAFAHLLGSAAMPKSAALLVPEKRPAKAEAATPATEPAARKAAPKAPAAPATKPHPAPADTATAGADTAATTPTAVPLAPLPVPSAATHASPDAPAPKPSTPGASVAHGEAVRPLAADHVLTRAAAALPDTGAGVQPAAKTTRASAAPTTGGTPVAAPKDDPTSGTSGHLKPATTAGAGTAHTPAAIATAAAATETSAAIIPHDLGATPVQSKDALANAPAAATPTTPTAATPTPATTTHIGTAAHGPARGGLVPAPSRAAEPIAAARPRPASPTPAAATPSAIGGGTTQETPALHSGREPGLPARRREAPANPPAALPALPKASEEPAAATPLAARLHSAAAAILPKATEAAASATPLTASIRATIATAANGVVPPPESITAGATPVAESPKPKAERVATARRDGHEPAAKAQKSPETPEARAPAAQPAETGTKSAAKDEGVKLAETAVLPASPAHDGEPVVAAEPERIVESRVALTRETPGRAAAVPTVAIRVHSKDGTTRAIEIRLDPPGIGRVDVRLETGSDGRLSAVLQTDTSQAFELLKRDSGALEAALRDAGVQLGDDGISFTLNDQGSGQAFARDSGYAGAFRRQEDSINDMTAAAAQPMAWRDGVVDIQV